MQVENFPTVLVIEGRTVYKYDGEFTFETVKTWLDTKAYKSEDVTPVSTNIEAFVRAGERIKMDADRSRKEAVME